MPMMFSMLNLKRSQSLQTMQEHSTRAIFFVNGFGAASWAPLVPVLRLRLSITEDTLGMLLLCIGIGSLLAMPIAGTVASKFGCRKVLTTAGIIFALLLLLICNISSLISAVVLFATLFGLTDKKYMVKSEQEEKNMQSQNKKTQIRYDETVPLSV